MIRRKMRETEGPEGQRTEEFVTVQRGKLFTRQNSTVNRLKRIIDRKKGGLIQKKQQNK
jgi:hypothetical protein